MPKRLFGGDRLRVALALALVLVCAAGGLLPAQTSAPVDLWSWTEGDWSARAADAGGEGLIAVIQKAGAARTAASRAFLGRLLARDGDVFEAALRALGEDPDSRLLDLLVAEARRIPNAAKKRLLVARAEEFGAHRGPSLERYLGLLDEPPAPDDALFAVDRLAALFADPPAPADAGRIVEALRRTHATTEDRGLAAAIFQASRRLPIGDRVDFDLAAIERLEAASAVAAARDLFEAKIDDAERLAAAAVFGPGARSARLAYLEALLGFDTPPLFLLHLIAAAGSASWADIGATARLLGKTTTPRSRTALAAALAAAFDAASPPQNAKSTGFALLVGAASGVRLPEARARSLIESGDRAAGVAASIHLAGPYADEISWRTLLASLQAKDFGDTIEVLDALRLFQPTGAYARSWIDRPLLATEVWQVWNAALQAAAACGHDRAVELALKAAAAPRWQTRLAAAEALATIDDWAAVHGLAGLACDDYARIAKIAADGIKARTGRGPFQSADEWRRALAAMPRTGPVTKLDVPAASRDDDRYSARFYGLELGSNKVVFVCDLSGSMEGGKLETLKTELSRAVGGFEAPGALNLVFFSSAARALYGALATMSAGNRAAVLEAVRSLSANGGTNIMAALDLALADPRADTIVLLTDGAPSVGTTDTDEILRRVRKKNAGRRIRIHAIWVDGPPMPGGGLGGSTFLERLAAQNDGRCIVPMR